MPSYSKVATGNIAPSVFVKLSTTLDGKVTQAGAGDKIYGISYPSQRNVPFSSLQDGFAAIAGETLAIYGPGDKDVLLMLGGTVAPGDRLKSDANGFGVATTSTADEIGAIAQEVGISGQIVAVQPIFNTQF